MDSRLTDLSTLGLPPSGFSLTQSGLAVPSETALSLVQSKLPRPYSEQAQHSFQAPDAFRATKKKVERTPHKLRDYFAEADYWAEHNSFVGRVLETRLGFQNKGLKIYVGDDWINDPDDESKLWTDNKRKISAYVRDVWREWNTNSNVVSFWFEDRPVLPTTLPLDSVEYTDRLGIEKLKYYHGMKSDEVKELGDKRFNTKYVELNGEDDQNFQVLKTERVGRGLGLPDLLSVFSACQEVERLDSAHNVYAEAAKILVWHHKMGHEIKSGQWAGAKMNFASPGRIKKVKKALDGKFGLIRWYGNFDHEIEFSAIDAKLFDHTKYDGAERWMLWWSFPIGQMLLAKGTTAPFLMPLLREQVLSARNLVGPFLQDTIGMALQLKEPVRIVWDETCFMDPRDLAATRRYAHKAGALSNTTMLRENGWDPNREKANKEEERKTPQLFLPLFDADHGQRPGANDSEGGRPAGGGNDDRTTDNDA